MLQNSKLQKGILLKIISLFYCLFFTVVSFAQTAYYKQVQTYIETYKQEAIEQMSKYGIPACITLAQGILESNCGNSALAQQANNHFGIKCHKNWEGKTFYMDDDAKNECFRKYSLVLDSYTDHSLFLKDRERYAFLFQLPISDYKAWANGLKQAGYATDPNYAQRLIKIIEDYKLYDYTTSYKNNETAKYATTKTSSISILKNNKVKYVIAKKGDTFFSIANNAETTVYKILKYNDLEKNAVLKDGQKIYINTKRRKCKQKEHVVLKNETPWSISQQYGIKLKMIYKHNKINKTTLLKEGQVLKL